jgi:hypothetical protein
MSDARMTVRSDQIDRTNWSDGPDGIGWYCAWKFKSKKCLALENECRVLEILHSKTEGCESKGMERTVKKGVQDLRSLYLGREENERRE